MDTQTTTNTPQTATTEQPKKQHSKTWLGLQSLKGTIFTDDPKYLWH